MLGWTAEELVGKEIHPIVHHTHHDGRHYPDHDCPIYAAFRDGAVHQVEGEVFWRKDGTPVWVEYTSTPIRDSASSWARSSCSATSASVARPTKNCMRRSPRSIACAS